MSYLGDRGRQEGLPGRGKGISNVTYVRDTMDDLRNYKHLHFLKITMHFIVR